MSEFQENVLIELEDVYGAIRKLVLTKAPVIVRIDGSDEEFSSLITETELKTRSFILDGIFPLSGHDLIRQGKRFTIEGEADGIRIRFRVSGRIMLQSQRNTYRIELPLKVLYLQRRSAYRVNIHPSHSIHLLLKMHDNENDLAGMLIDLSSTGFKAKFHGNVKKRLDEQGHFPQARLRFNRAQDIDCGLTSHHSMLTEDGLTQCGFSFESISGAAQRYIDKLINDLQWEEREISAPVEDTEKDLSDPDAADKTSEES